MARPTISQSTAAVRAPLERIDIARWLHGLDTDEYVSFTPRSRAHKSFRAIGDAGGLAFESVEFLSGAIMSHRYVPEVMEPHRIACVSPDTRARFLYVVPLRFRTVWTLDVDPGDEDTSTLTCRIEVTYHRRIWSFLSGLVGTGFWLRRHSREETPRFAESIAAEARGS